MKRAPYPTMADVTDPEYINATKILAQWQRAVNAAMHAQDAIMTAKQQPTRYAIGEARRALWHKNYEDGILATLEQEEA